MTDIPDPPDPVEMPDFKFTALRQVNSHLKYRNSYFLIDLLLNLLNI